MDLAVGKYARRFVAVTGLTVALLLSSLPALAQVVPTNLRAVILLRALAYEKSFATEKQPASLLIVAGSKGSKDAAEVKTAWDQVASSGTLPRAVSVASVVDTTAEDVAKRALTAVYLAVGTEAAPAWASSLKKTIVLCGDPALVGKGCLLSVELSGTSPRLVVDLAGAEKAGVRFDARMLQLARVIR